MVHLLFVLMVITASQEPSEQGLPSEDRWLILVPGATDVDRRNGPAWVSIYYEVKEPYPATSTTSHILKSMSRNGWTLVREGWSHTESSPHSTVKTRHTWKALWRDASDFDVSYRVDYACKFADLGLHSAWATVSVGLRDRVRSEAYRESVRERARDRARQQEPKPEE